MIEYISTDNEENAEVSKKYGASVPFLRPAELATNDLPTIDTVIYTLNILSEDFGYNPDALVLLQPTSPFRTSADIDATHPSC